MVGIPTPPERGCGWLSYAGISDCCYVGHREGSHPMCEGHFEIIHAKDMHNHSIYDLVLAIYLGMEGRGFGELGVQQ
jgi:hypothetical protein